MYSRTMPKIPMTGESWISGNKNLSRACALRFDVEPFHVLLEVVSRIRSYFRKKTGQPTR